MWPPAAGGCLHTTQHTANLSASCDVAADGAFPLLLGGWENGEVVIQGGHDGMSGIQSQDDRGA